MDEKIILVAKMYTGKYIEKNIGHEIINFFKPDIGDKYYGYIINDGKLKDGNYDKIQTILFVSDKKDNKIKILGKLDKDKDNLEFIVDKKATDKQSQITFIKDNNIRYGGVYLNDIMNKSEVDDYGIYISYSANNVYKPKEDYYLLLKDSKEIENNYNKKINKNIGHQYCYISDSDKTEKADYKKISDLIKSINWKKEEIKIDEKIQNKYGKYYNELYDNKESFMDLINKEYDEIVFSNMLYYYFHKKGMFKKFAEEILKMNVSDNIKIEREKNIDKGRIDIWIEDDKNKKCIVIENKLKSAINGRYVSDDDKTERKIEKSQLDKYIRWVDNYKENNKKKFEDYEKKYCIFVPNYKTEELIKDIDKNNLMPKDTSGKGLYQIIEYKEIFEFFYEQKNNMENDKYYIDFLRALSKHIYTAEEEMERKFVYAIKKCK